MFRILLNNSSLIFYRRFIPVLLILIGLTTAVYAQEEVIRVETDLVGFEATVTDRDGKPVRGLELKDFKIYEDGVQRSVDFFEPIKKSVESRPLAVVFALDVSGSMTGEELAQLRSSLQHFIDRLADYNSYFSITTFGMQVKTLQSFTNRPDKLEKSLGKLMR
ncbi:MAG: VWA domain-containing protein, partial [Pyrinomonadaceae bacterium]